jgi:hypothetical protein
MPLRDAIGHAPAGIDVLLDLAFAIIPARVSLPAGCSCADGSPRVALIFYYKRWHGELADVS